MKHLKKLWIRIALAVAVSFILAGGMTDISYPIPTDRLENGERGGVIYEDVLSNPGDLLNNEQDSLVRFSKTFAVLSVVIVSAVSIPSLTKKKNPEDKGTKS